MNGAELFGTLCGRGEPLVLVHGGWTDHTTWRGIVPALSESFRVVAYDRRGHSRSQAADDGPRALHEDDLVAIIELLGLGPVHLVGSSYGALISLGVGARRPDLVRSIVAHEPPAGPLDAMFASFATAIRAGNAADVARRFVEEVLGKGMWERLPGGLRETMVSNAPTFLETLDDPRAGDVDVEALAQHRLPVLLTNGSATPAWLREIVPALADAIGADRHTYAGAGHMPHGTHPDELVAVVRAFTRSAVGAR